MMKGMKRLLSIVCPFGVGIYTSLKLHFKMVVMCIIIISMVIAAYIVLQQGIIDDPDPVVVVPLDMKK